MTSVRKHQPFPDQHQLSLDQSPRRHVVLAMGLFKRKKKPGDMLSLQAEAQSAQVAPAQSEQQQPESTPEHPPPDQQLSPQSSQGQGSQDEGDDDTGETAADKAANMDLLDPTLLGRTIRLVKSDDWEEDLIQVPSPETQILYENQRGYCPQDLPMSINLYPRG